jgi:hypothetical protein
MPRARPNLAALTAGITERIEQFRPHGIVIDADAWAEVETFVAIALRVMARTNPSRIRDAAMVEEIKARMDGRGVVE